MVQTEKKKKTISLKCFTVMEINVQFICTTCNKGLISNAKVGVKVQVHFLCFLPFIRKQTSEN